MKTSLRLLAALLLLIFAASTTEAAWIGWCAYEVPTESHSHGAPGEADPAAPPSAPAEGCPMPLASHAGCVAVSLPAVASAAEFQVCLQSSDPVEPAEEHTELLARDRFHPPRR